MVHPLLLCSHYMAGEDVILAVNMPWPIADKSKIHMANPVFSYWIEDACQEKRQRYYLLFGLPANERTEFIYRAAFFALLINFIASAVPLQARNLYRFPSNLW